MKKYGYVHIKKFRPWALKFQTDILQNILASQSPLVNFSDSSCSCHAHDTSSQSNANEQQQNDDKSD